MNPFRSRSFFKKGSSDGVSFDFEPSIGGRPVLGLRRRIGVVKRLAVRTGRLRRSPVVHSRPIDLVVFQEPSYLAILETSS